MQQSPLLENKWGASGAEIVANQNAVLRHGIELSAMATKPALQREGVGNVFDIDLVRARVQRPERFAGTQQKPVAFSFRHLYTFGIFNSLRSPGSS